VPAILTGLGGNRGLLGDVIDVFLEEAPQRIAAARAALEQGDASEIASQAHTLKSMVGLFTMAEPFAAARELEAIGKRGDLIAAAEGIATLDSTVAALADRLRALRLDLQK
jgi:HPt (histidine-containing phosphotransfer) domain-containing protein